MSETTASTALDRTDRPPHVGRLAVFALAVIGAAVIFALQASESHRPLVLAALAIPAIAGIFALFALAFGLARLGPRTAGDDLMRSIADTAGEGLIVVAADGAVVYANAAYRRLTGAAAGADPLPPELLLKGAPAVSEALYRLVQSARAGQARGEELRLSPPLSGGGQAGWYRVAVRPLGRADADPVLWSIADITADRDRQENVFQELQHAIDYLDQAPAGFLSLERDGGIVYMNATLASWLDHDLASVGTGGLTLADVVSINAAALFDGVTGAAGEIRTEILDLDFRRRGGQMLPVRLFHRVGFDAEGRRGPSRTLVLNRSPGEDVAEGLRQAEVRFARFFNNTPVAIATVTRDGAIARSNASFSRLFGTPARREGEAASVGSITAERDSEQLIAAVKAAAAGEDVLPFDAAIAGDGGRSARFYVSGVDDVDSDGEAAIIYALDTTEQRTLEAQFAQAQKMNAVGQLAGGVAHDFNNVLQAIIGYSDLLLGKHRPTDPSFQDIMQIKQNANRAASLVRQLLAFSRRQTLRPQVVQIGDILSDLSLLLKRLLGERVELDVHHGRDLWPVKADINQFEQVIVNLAVNARDAMPSGGQLSIRTQNVPASQAQRYDEAMPAADYVMIEAQDTGTGMPPEVLAQIFEPFFTTKEVGKGTGLGLSTVYGIVKQTGGFILCESEVGRGTAFRIFLPRHQAEPEVPAVEDVTKAKKPAMDLTGHGTILLVEDEEAVRAFAARALATRGYTVLEATSGREAVSLLEQRGAPVDLIVSDVVMPEMDGPSLLRELRARDVKAKVVFVSGYAEDAFKKNLPDGESFVFLPKPFSLKQLIEAVKSQMG
ncbi:cell cycle histidine kinase CckA [Chelatococcus reniformis]|uniref:histidine kinase n=1 Tax=Chelatococcus reniformis TaxID=1494448 RepID=A0A916UTM8_9HYPH|nr:PAS domain-containing sensor histidine kinase [Chelatococcus reniformis]GGC84448.1 signal transduction histidine kinase [Chelatococcus reniformis]